MGRVFSSGLAAVGLGLIALAAVLWLFFPLGCWEADSAPGTTISLRGGCPRSLSHIGLEWSNIWTGLVAAPLLSLLSGLGVGVYTWRVMTGAHSQDND
jgi:hypothetical protein